MSKEILTRGPSWNSHGEGHDAEAEIKLGVVSPCKSFYPNFLFHHVLLFQSIVSSQKTWETTEMSFSLYLRIKSNRSMNMAVKNTIYLFLSEKVTSLRVVLKHECHFKVRRPAG